MSFPTSSSSHSRNLLEGDSGLPLEPSTGSDLARVAPLTFKVVTRIHVAKIETTDRATQGESPALRSEEIEVNTGSYDMELSTSRVTLA